MTQMTEKKKPLIILTGPTAVGKTAASIGLAKAIGGEIISADSMQVYRHMDIGSAKVTVEEMQGRVEVCERDLKVLALDDVRDAVNNLTVKEGKLKLLQKDSEGIAEKKKELEELRLDLAQASNQLPVAARDVAVAVAAEETQVDALAALEVSFGKASESLSDWARIARAQLQPPQAHR